MITRRKFLGSAAIGAAGMVTGVTLPSSGAEAATPKPVWERAPGTNESVSDELFDRWVQQVLRNVAHSLGVPYERLTGEFKSEYRSARPAGLKSKKVLPG